MLVAYSKVAVVVDYQLEGAVEPAVSCEFTTVEELLNWTVISSLKIILVFTSFFEPIYLDQG